jgi:undecaprenyl diphosphate synthase
MGLFSKKASARGPVICDDRLSHIAFIMDGNGRWAKKRGLAREAGHAEGARNMRRILNACKERNIRIVTVYAFSTENWKRPKEEVDAIMALLDEYLDTAWREHEENKVHVRVIGDISVLTPQIQEKITTLDAATAEYEMVLNLAINYGGRQEILHAVNRALLEGKQEVTEADIVAGLYTAGIPDPDLIVRTSGETRTSNFLLWQSAYAEYAFTKTPWPAFSAKELDEILADFYSRHRRHGGL